MDTQIDRIAEWQDWLSVDKSPATVEGYIWELRALEKFFPDKAVIELSAADLARYVAHRRVLKKCSDATIRRSINAMRNFYAHILGKRRSPANRLPVPKTRKKRQRSLTWAKVEALLLACDTSTARGRRDLAIVCLLLDSGLRESELCRLLLSDVSMDERRLTVQIKGGDDGDGIFSRDTQAALSAWLALRPHYAAPGVQNFFVSIGGTKPGTPITPSGLRVIFRRLGAAAGFERLSPHDLRRSFATLSSKLGAPTRVLQVAGRWENIEMVVNYTRDIEAEDFDRYSPVSHALMPKP